MHIWYFRAQEITGNPCKSTKLHAFRWPTTSGSRGKAGRVWLLILRRRASSLTFDAYMCHVYMCMHCILCEYMRVQTNRAEKHPALICSSSSLFRAALGLGSGYSTAFMPSTKVLLESNREDIPESTWKILKGAEIAKGDRYIKQTLQELPFKHIWAVKCALHHSMSNLEMSRFSLCARLRESALSCAPVRPLCGQVFLLNFAKLWTLWFEQSWG